MPRMQVPRMPDGKPNGRAGQMLWYGGLAAVAAMGVVEWPVAAVVAAGSYVVDRRMKAARRTKPADAQRTGRRKESGTRTRTRAATGRSRRPQ
ncbi:hypothetical protein [Actinopolymorpha sp. B9G3]|uniref:hypothetical protein n=1 Tax=Actinopolymorpha sp. B9G3 TaxID=3158970 RepID=UPI0032D98C65